MTELAEAMTCREMVELVTDYLEGALTKPERRRFEDHIGGCPGCTNYLEQMRLVIKAGGRLSEEAIDPPARDALLDAFRGWNSDRGAPA
jgi:anti-sigma factor RsiW